MDRSVPANAQAVNAARQVCVICETRKSLNTPREKSTSGVALWRRAAIWPVSAVLRLWWRTIRIEMPAEDLGVVTGRGRPVIFVLWHNRLFLTPEFVIRYRGGHPIYSLVSPSGDGAWLAALFHGVGMGAVRGSSSRGGREAATALVEALQSGCDIGITPDGPRGPVYALKPGALVVARRAGSLLVLVGMDFESAWRVGRWDGFYIPRPFSRVQARFVTVDPSSMDDSEEAARHLGRRLVELNPDRNPAPVRRRG
jgi:lysophospholipid acyltransferase (LPLAT)-like uncharacterized protein